MGKSTIVTKLEEEVYRKWQERGKKESLPLATMRSQFKDAANSRLTGSSKFFNAEVHSLWVY